MTDAGTGVGGMEDVLVSPCCTARLEERSDEDLSCSTCGQRFPRVGDTFDLIPREYREDRRVRTWTQIHERYVARNQETAEVDSARRATYVAYHQEFLRDFCDLQGRVLDVGCGPMLEHLGFLEDGALEDISYVGVDPEASFVSGGSSAGRLYRGVGEYLPFADGSFDTVLMISVLDHVILPRRVLAEVHRVLGPGGRFFQSLPMREITWRTRLRELLGARRVRKHVNEFNEPRLLRALGRAGFRVTRKRRSSESPKNLFVQVSPDGS